MDPKTGSTISDQPTTVAQQPTNTMNQDNGLFKQKLQSTSTSELDRELGTLKWHYMLFEDDKKLEMIRAIEQEIARRKPPP
jgi:hypothetical protein